MTKKVKKQLYDIDVESFLCLPANVYWLDENSKIVGCNLHTANLLGMTPDDCVGITYDDIIQQANWTQEQAYSMWNDDLEVMSKDHFKKGVFEPPVPGPDGKLRYYVSTRSPLHDSNGKVKGVFGISIDITDSYPVQDKMLNVPRESMLLSNFAFTNLSVRQSECLYYLVRGMTAKQIAKTLHLSHRTIEFYLDNLKVKFQCKTRSELVSKAFEMGFEKYCINR
jgi:PAS domain S-box-containing protein